MHFTEVRLQTNSIARTRLFYSKSIGLDIVDETDVAITFKAGNSLLMFSAVTGSRPYYHIAFNITNNKFSEAFEAFNHKLDILEMETGIPIAAYPEWNAQSFYCYDNNGSVLEFITRFDLDYQSAEPYSPADIREISEVGIVTHNVPVTTNHLHTKYGFHYFHRSKPTEHFAVLGNDHGLFIISHAGRPWVPTDKPSMAFPLTVVADGQEISFE
ncbi:MAG: hypothetical protein V4649_17870 [Bacteroidota bacterium]